MKSQNVAKKGLKVAGVIAVVSALALLTGCAATSTKASPTPKTNNCTVPAAGKAASSVTVDGKFGAGTSTVATTGTPPVTAKFTAPLTADGLERADITTGKDAPAPDGSLVKMEFNAYLASSGKWLFSQPLTTVVGNSQELQAISVVSSCVSPGTRSVVVAPPSALFGDAGIPSLGVGSKDIVIVVLDTIEIVTAKEWTTGTPEVTFGADSKPSVVLPSSGPPEDLRVKVLKQGTGPVLQNGETISYRYQLTTWADGKLLEQNFGADPAQGALSGFVPGFTLGLVGQKVGSTVAISVPPLLAYGINQSTSELGGKYLFFVVEIVAVVPSATPSP